MGRMMNLKRKLFAPLNELLFFVHATTCGSRDRNSPRGCDWERRQGYWSGSRCGYRVYTTRSS